MSANELLNENETRTAVTLANAGELTANIIKEIAGNDVSNSLNNNVITRDLIVNMACRRINANLMKRLNA